MLYQGFRLCCGLFIAYGEFYARHVCKCHVEAIADVLVLCLVRTLGLFHRRQTNQAELVASVMQPSSCTYGTIPFINMAHAKIHAQALINRLLSFRAFLKLGRFSQWDLSYRRRDIVPLLRHIQCQSSWQYLPYQMTFLAPQLGHLSTLG